MDEQHFEAQFPEKTLEEQIAKTLQFVKTGASAQIVGLPGSGKSTLLKLLAYNHKVRAYHLQKDLSFFHFLYMDMSEVYNRPLQDIIKFFLISLSHSLTERKKIEEAKKIDQLLKKALQFGNDELVLFHALKDAVEYVALGKNLHLVFLIDRFETYQQAPEQFFINLTILKELLHEKFSVVFSLPRPLDMLFDPSTFAEFYQYVGGNTVFIPIHNTIGLEFVISQLEKVTGEKLSSEKEREILSLTGGQNKLSRLSIEAAMSEESTKNLTEFLLKRRQIKAALEEIWDFLTPHEKNHILHPEKDANDEDFLLLTKMGLLKNHTLTIPLLEEYSKEFKTQTGELNYVSETNEILKGEDNLTEQLSPSEFRLLRFLILNKGRVCEKDEIIQAVWKDTKTQEGVTDQALDQIMYRLRKKIEDNPNTPQYLKTIKGKGYQLTP